MSDEEALNKIVDSFYLFHGNEIAGVKDTASRHLITSDGYADLLGIAKEDIVGRSDVDILCPISKEFKPVFQQQDREVEKDRQTHKYLDIHCYKNGLEVFVFTKKPIINQVTNNVLGTIYIGSKLRFDNVKQIVYISKLKKIDLSELVFSEREAEILFCYYHGLINYKKIAYVINSFKRNALLNENKVKYVAKRILQLTNTITMEDAIEILAASGYVFSIPRNLMKSGSYFLGWLD